jgi:hypothetical protein
MAGVLVPLLGVLALREISEGTVSREKAARSVLIAAMVTGGLAFIFLPDTGSGRIIPET